MKTTGILIMRPDEPHEKREVQIADKDGVTSYLAIAKIVEPIIGGTMEHVTVFGDFHGGSNYHYLDMFVAETGALDGLPLNYEATAIYRRNTLVHSDRYRPDDLPAIYGPAVLFERRVWQ
jgi:hypothetical protein